jgi:hypothetical protein
MTALKDWNLMEILPLVLLMVVEYWKLVKTVSDDLDIGNYCEYFQRMMMIPAVVQQVMLSTK